MLEPVFICDRGHEVKASNITVHKIDWVESSKHLQSTGCWKCGKEGLQRKTNWKLKK